MSNFIVIPAHNEQQHLAEVMRNVKKYADNIIVVDDGSHDNTFKIAEQEGAIVLKHLVNMGKGAALKTGCDYAYEKGAQKIVVLDSDGQHDPHEIPHFLKALEEHDIAYGHRRPNQQQPFVLKFGNNFINTTLKTLFKTQILDSQCGYRSFTRKAYSKIRWQATDYYMETEMIIKSAQHKLTSTHIPIETIYGDKYKGTTVLDGVKIVAKMCTMRLFQ